MSFIGRKQSELTQPFKYSNRLAFVIGVNDQMQKIREKNYVASYIGSKGRAQNYLCNLKSISPALSATRAFFYSPEPIFAFLA